MTVSNILSSNVSVSDDKELYNLQLIEIQCQFNNPLLHHDDIIPGFNSIWKVILLRAFLIETSIDDITRDHVTFTIDPNQVVDAITKIEHNAFTNDVEPMHQNFTNMEFELEFIDDFAIFRFQTLDQIELIFLVIKLYFPTFHIADAKMWPVENVFLAMFRYPISLIPKIQLTTIELDPRTDVSLNCICHHSSTVRPFLSISTSFNHFARQFQLLIYHHLTSKYSSCPSQHETEIEKLENEISVLNSITLEDSITDYTVDMDYVRTKTEYYMKVFPIPEHQKIVSKFPLPSTYRKLPVLHFKDLPLDVVNTLFVIFPKKEAEKQNYVNLRYLFIVLFLSAYQLTRSERIAAIHVSKILIFELKTINNFDYFAEYLLRLNDELQKDVLTFILMGLLSHPEYDKLMASDNPLDHLPEELDVGDIDLSRFELMTRTQNSLRVKNGRYLSEIPIENILQEANRAIVQLGQKTPGTHDNSRYADYILNSLNDLFPGLNNTTLVRPSIQIDRESIIFARGTMIELDYSDSISLSFLYGYQILSMFMPLIGEKIAPDHLVSKKHHIKAYDQTFGVNFSAKHEIETADFDNFGKKIWIQGLYPENIEKLMLNFSLLKKHNPRTFDVPRLTILSATVIVRHHQLEIVHNYLKDILGNFTGSNTYIPLNNVLSKATREKCSVVLDRNSIHLYLKSRFFRDHNLAEISDLNAFTLRSGFELSITSFETIIASDTFAPIRECLINIAKDLQNYEVVQ